MPLVLLNLRALPNGLESHKQYLGEEAEQWLGHTDQADVTFICSNSVKLMAHQAVLAPLSPVLKEMFAQQSCGHTRQIVSISMDTDPQVMQAVLSLVYKGSANLSTLAVQEVQSIVRMLGLTFKGGFERIMLPAGSAQSETTPNKASVKRPHSTSPPQESKKSKPSPHAKPTPPLSLSMTSKPSPAKVSATDRMNMHVAMTLQLKEKPSGATATCKIPNCGAEVTYEQLADHFTVHETEDKSKENGGPISFPCVACGINFKFRRELESHTKNKHGGGMANIRDKLDLLSDSDTSSDEDTFDPPLSETTSAKSTKKSSVTCTQCNKVVLSSWHLPPSKHECYKAVSPLVLKRPTSTQSVWSVDKDATNYCNICDHMFKTTMAKNVHVRQKHPTINKEKPSPPAKELLEVNPPATSTPSSYKTHGCQICTKRFNELCKLRTHYTLYHFWDNLVEDYKYLEDQCNICMKKFPTEDHLIQHMGNFHSIIDKYLVKKGLRIFSNEKTVKLLSWRCEFCKVNQTSSAALKSHLSVKHYQKEILAEFPIEKGKTKRCPKCYKIFEGASISTVVGHVGSFHDEVIKYATDVLDLAEVDKDNIPADDFDDGAIGVAVVREDSSSFKCEKCGNISKSRADLKNHYLDSHYAGQFMTTYPVPFCSYCDQEYQGLALLHKHLVNKHEAVFVSMLAKDGIAIPPEHSPRRKNKVELQGTFDFLFCQICLQKFQSSKSLKIHYIRHYQIHFQSQYFIVKCPYCDKKFDDVMTTQKHIASEHDELSLIPMMEKENLWVNKSVILDNGSAKLKRIGIPIKKVDSSVVKKHFDVEVVAEATSQVDKKLDCAIPTCDRVFSTRNEFLIHLAISHFWKELSLDFGEAFQTDSLNCPICKEKVNPNREKTIYYKHLAVAHETVMKYVQTVARKEPRTLQPNSGLVVSSSPTTSAAPVPVIRFSNETVSDAEAANGDSNSVGGNVNKSQPNVEVNGTKTGTSISNENLPVLPEEIKNEITTEDNLSSVVNSDLMSKIRNVFSDDSDSD